MDRYIKDQAKLKSNEACHSSRIPKDKVVSLKPFNQTENFTLAHDDKENINLNSSLSVAEQKEKLKQIKLKKKTMSRNDIKNIDLNQIKFHKTYVNQKSNTLVSQICMKDDKELKLETPNIAFEEDKQNNNQRNAKIIKDCGLQKGVGCGETTNFRENQINNLEIIEEEQNKECIHNPYIDRESSLENRVLVKDHNNRSKSARSDSNAENSRQPRLRKENSYKIAINQRIEEIDELQRKHSENEVKDDHHFKSSQESEFLKSTNGASYKCQNYSDNSKSVKIDKVLVTSSSLSSYPVAARCVSPDIALNDCKENIVLSPSNIHASPNTKKIILQQAQNIQALQNQINELQKLVRGVVSNQSKPPDFTQNHILRGSTSSTKSNKFNPMNTPYDQEITPSNSSHSFKSKNFTKNYCVEPQRESVNAKIDCNPPPSLKEGSPPFDCERRHPSHYLSKKVAAYQNSESDDEIKSGEHKKQGSFARKSYQDQIENQYKQDYIKEHNQSSSLDWDHKLSNPNIFSDDKAETRFKRCIESNDKNSKKRYRKKIDKTSSKVSIIHLKKKQLHKSSSIDNNTVSKKIKKKIRDRNNTKSDVGLLKTSHVNLAKIQKEIAEFDQNKYNDQPLKREMQTIEQKVNTVLKCTSTPKLVFNQPAIIDQKDLVMTENHPNPLIGQLGGVDCLSIIKDEDTTLKLSEINVCTRGSIKINNNKNVDDSDFLNDSNMSQYFMANPANEKTNLNGLDYHHIRHDNNLDADMNEIKDSEHKIKKDTYVTCNGVAKDDWTMDVPKIKYNDEQMSNSSDSKSS